MTTTNGPAGRGLAQQDTNGTSAAASERLFVVRVSQSCCEPLAGRGPGEYRSPPQPLPAARALVALLAGRNHVEQIAAGELTVAVAGGRRTITLEAAG